MKDILSPRHRGVLEALAAAPCLLAFDYDGVLAPLVRDPAGAFMRPRTRRLLRRVARLYPCAVVSGRAFRDTRRFVGRLVPTVVGNHGYEIGEETATPPEVLERVRGWERELRRRLAGVPGIFFEQKRATLAVHYGLTRTWRRSGEAVRAAAEALHGARLIEGKRVMNVLPSHFPTKGDAVRALLERQGLETALYAGDDVTDEDVFRIGPPAVLGIHVGRGRSLAPWRLAAQQDTDALLGRLLELRGGRRWARGAQGRRSHS